MYYHVSNESLKEGTILEPYYGCKITNPIVYSSSDHFYAQYLREMIFEDYRAVHFSEKPSRLKSVYLFDDIDSAKKYKENYQMKYIYLVSVTKDSIIHKADMTFINLTVRKSIKEIHDLAFRFFNGESTNQKDYEILCEGTAKITSLV